MDFFPPPLPPYMDSKQVEKRAEEARAKKLYGKNGLYYGVPLEAYSKGELIEIINEQGKYHSEALEQHLKHTKFLSSI